MSWENNLERWVNTIRNQLALPLRIDLWNGQQFAFSHENPKVVVHIPHSSALNYLLKPSLLNLGKAYVDGKIDVDGTASEIITVGNALASYTLKPEGKFARLRHNFNHSRKKDAEAIQYHYDVSNDFYTLWLDKNLVYSCAYFENGNEDLATAQLKKIDHVLKKIQLQPGHTLLDIGCGWGSLVLRAAQHYGAKCIGITLSEKQAELAKMRVAQAGLSNQIEIRLEDYRDISGPFDRITSIGMYEHVGLKHLPAYFSKIQSLLNHGGLAMNHGITSVSPDNRETPYGGGKFIANYVFPYGELAHIGFTLQAMQEGGLEALDIENLRRHYAKTCSIWAENFETHAHEIKQLAGDRRFRIWRLYLAGCSHAFDQDWISLFQVVCAKAGQHSSKLPWSRRYMYLQ